MKTSFDVNFNNYLNNCKNQRNIKCAIVATDKQCVILLDNEDINCDSHNKLAECLENMIHPNDQRMGWSAYRANNVYIFLEGPELIANLPLDGTLSTNQAVFILDILKTVCDFNYENDDLMSIDIISTNDYRQYHSHDLNLISKYIISLITDNYIVEEEKIIGKTISNNNITSEETIKIYKKS